MGTLELHKDLAHLYKPSAKIPVTVDVPPMRFLVVDGVGDVGGEAFRDAIQALYGLSYPVRFAAKKQLDLTYKVMPLEGLYWDARGGYTINADTEEMAWRLMILLPDAVSSEFVDGVRDKVAAKKDLPRLSDVRVQTLSEGQSVQIMHIGPYADETPTVDRLIAYAAERGFEVSGAHHEIYIGDPNRSAPEKLKTVLRYPVKRARR